MSEQERYERVVAADALEATWLHFQRLTSQRLCEKVVRLRSNDLEQSVVEKKAVGVASAVRSVIGYWRSVSASLNARVLTRYYALLQASIAEQVASGDPRDDLDSVQRHTQSGHGLAAVMNPESSEGFPYNYYVVPMRSGHFSSYAKSIALDLSNASVERRPTEKEWSKCGPHVIQFGVSLAELLLRVPELQSVAPECLGKRALSFHVGHSSKNNSVRSAIMRGTAVPNQGTHFTYAAIYGVDVKAETGDWLRTLQLPFGDLEVHEPPTKFDQPSWIGKVEHPVESHWWSHFQHYKSDYCGTSVVAPFWGSVADPFVVHFAALYALSIVVRYLPSLWHRVEYGDLDHIRVLIDHYLAIVDRVGPGMVLSRITGKKLLVSSPGSLSSPV